MPNHWLEAASRGLATSASIIPPCSEVMMSVDGRGTTWKPEDCQACTSSGSPTHTHSFCFFRSSGVTIG